jgi:choloylglycine hydrolase
MGIISNNYPLYFDATNEKGLSIAGLNFPYYADYKHIVAGKKNITPFELIPWLLSQCSNVKEAKEKLQNANIVNVRFSDEYPLTPLHWLISDSEGSITVESVREGLNIYDNKVGVLTNNPPFDMQMFNLNNYMNITREEPTNRFCESTDLYVYSRGMGAMGLPGDLSSQSRFVRATFTKLNSECGANENESVSQFFHILDTVSQTRGSVRVGNGFEITDYYSCCNTDKGIYYYKTYENSQISAVMLFNEDLDKTNLVKYNLVKEQQIRLEN